MPDRRIAVRDRRIAGDSGKGGVYFEGKAFISVAAGGHGFLGAAVLQQCADQPCGAGSAGGGRLLDGDAVSDIENQSQDLHAPFCDEKGERMEAGLELENNSRIPLVWAETQIRLKNLFYPETETIRLTGAADAKSRVRILKGFVGEHCGPVELELGQVWVWDFLRIFKGRVKVTQKERWVILPRMYQAMIRPDEKIRNSPDDSEEYDKTRPGDDVSEIFQLREYRPETGFRVSTGNGARQEKI